MAQHHDDREVERVEIDRTNSSPPLTPENLPTNAPDPAHYRPAM